MPHSVKIVYWEDDGGWIGYLDEYPDYWTQGDTLDDLRAHLKDLSRSHGWSCSRSAETEGR